MEFAVGASAATLKSLLGKLSTLLAKEYEQIRGVRGDIQFIADELTSMQAFLSNLSKSEEKPDDQTEGWMKQIRDVAYDIEDCVDDFTHNLDPDPTGDGCLTDLRRTLYEVRTCWPRRDIAAKTAELKERAQQVGGRRRRYGVPDPQSGKHRSNLGGATGYLAAEHQGVTRQLVRVRQPMGVKEMPDLENWIRDESRKPLGVLSIVGFGGVGKTTVGMALYRNLEPHFKSRAMVTVSQSSDTEVVLRNVLSQVKLLANNGEGQREDSAASGSEKKIPIVGSILNQIHRLPCLNHKEDGSAGREKLKEIKTELRKYLETSRYLLLIDDVWSSSTWQDIRNNIPENDKASRIIVTTRIPAVARTCSARNNHDYVHKAEVLSHGEARSLFQKTLEEAGRDTGESQPSWYKVPARVWEMCGGLPLAIVTMAGLVASNSQKNRDEWMEVCNSLFPEPKVCHKPEEFLKIITHCYNDLDSDLKTCSLYLSIFPKGSKISRNRLTRRWIAEGFISEKQGLSVEDVAEAYFNQLLKRKIIRSVEHSSNGRVKCCQVHDMVLEYIISKAAEEDFISVIGSHWSMPIHSNKVRRLSIHSSDPKRANDVDSLNRSHVRSLTVFGSMGKLHFKSFKTGIILVLDLEGCSGFKENSIKESDICEMILLKYLSLRRTDIKRLPKNISRLKYLETLDIRETDVQQLPATIGQLEQINNILGGDKRKRRTLKLPKDLKGRMKTLRILSGIEIGEASTAASDLGYFTGLKKLAIYRIPNNGEVFKELLSSIQYLSGYSLKTLVIHDDSSEFLKTLDSMSSPTDLISLELSGKLLGLPKWLNSLSKLVKLTLSATALRTDNLLLLKNLSSLFSLTFFISEKQDPSMAAILEKNKRDSGGEIFVPPGGFSKLKLLRIFVPLLPPIIFSKKATPHLERIEMGFKSLEGIHGMAELGNIHDVLLTVDGQANEQTKLILARLRNVEKPSSKYALVVKYQN